MELQSFVLGNESVLETKTAISYWIVSYSKSDN